MCIRTPGNCWLGFAQNFNYEIALLSAGHVFAVFADADGPKWANCRLLANFLICLTTKLTVTVERRWKLMLRFTFCALHADKKILRCLNCSQNHLSCISHWGFWTFWYIFLSHLTYLLGSQRLALVPHRRSLTKYYWRDQFK